MPARLPVSGRIVIVSPFYKPSIGGVEYIAYNVAEGLARRGFEVHVITTPYDNKWEKIAGQGVTRINGVIVHRLGILPVRLGYAALMKGFKAVLRRLQPLVVHSHNLHPHLFQAISLKRELNYKLVAQLHFPVATGIDHVSARLLYRLVTRRLRSRQDGVDYFIAHTRSEKEWLVSEGINEDRIVIVPHPFIPDELLTYQPSSDAHDVFGADEVIVYISRIHPRKGQDLLVKAVSKVRRERPDLKVMIAGPVSDKSYAVRLKDLIARLGLEDTIDLVFGPLSEGEKLDVMATADLFACTPVSDLHPIVITEAVALGTPVVATRVGAIPEMLELGLKRVPEDKRPLLLSEPDPDSLASKLVTGLERSESITPEVYRIVVEPYTLSSVLDRLIGVYGLMAK